MLRVRRINDMEALRRMPTSPPLVMAEAVEATEERSEPWFVIHADPGGGDDPRWVAVFPERKEALFFNGEETLKGRWDEGHEVFVEEEGAAWTLMGRKATISALEDDAAEEDAGFEEEARLRLPKRDDGEYPKKIL